MGTPVVNEYPSLFRSYLHVSNHLQVTELARTSGSETMSLVQLFVPTEVAHDTVAELGELGNMQFKDVRSGLLNSCYMELTMSCTAEPQRQSLPTIIHRRDSSH